MIDVLAEIARTGIVRDAAGNEYEARPAGIPEKTGLLLARLVREAGAQRTLETGFAYGLSTLFICEALRERHGDPPPSPKRSGVLRRWLGAAARRGSSGPLHTVIDPCQDSVWHNVGLENARRAGFESMLRFFGKSSHTVLPQLLDAKERFGLVFLDGSHLFDYVFIDFFYADKMIEVGHHIVLDDKSMPAVSQLIDFVTSNLRYEVVPSDEAPNVCVLCKTGDSDERAWDHHVRF